MSIQQLTPKKWWWRPTWCESELVCIFSAAIQHQSFVVSRVGCVCLWLDTATRCLVFDLKCALRREAVIQPFFLAARMNNDRCAWSCMGWSALRMYTAFSKVLDVTTAAWKVVGFCKFVSWNQQPKAWDRYFDTAIAFWKIWWLIRWTLWNWINLILNNVNFSENINSNVSLYNPVMQGWWDRQQRLYFDQLYLLILWGQSLL